MTKVDLVPLTTDGADLANATLAFGQDAFALGRDISLPPGAVRPWLERALAADTEAWFAVQLEDGSRVGIAWLHHIDYYSWIGALGLWIHPDHRKRGIGAQAHLALLTYGFEVLRLYRLSSVILGHAQGARSFVSATMRYEGCIRHMQRIGGRWWVDGEVYGLTAEEFQAGARWEVRPYDAVRA